MASSRFSLRDVIRGDDGFSEVPYDSNGSAVPPGRSDFSIVTRHFVSGCYGYGQVKKSVSVHFSLEVFWFFVFGCVTSSLAALRLLRSAIRTRTVSVPYDIRCQEEERGAPHLICGFSQLTHASHRARAAPKVSNSVHCLFEPQFFLGGPSGIDPPQVNGQPSADGHDGLVLGSATALGLSSTGCHRRTGG